jgi:WXXGXW repeat (2 copies)
MRSTFAIRPLLLSIMLLIFAHSALAEISLGISVNFGPPALPVYEQPILPAQGFLWTPGYWAYESAGGYYWVPGTWIQPPQVGFLWTPGFWGWGGNAFFFHQGYWGQHVGFYGGINYGFGYGGNGYEGGRWDGGHFAYNTSVNHVDTTVIHNTYNTTVVNNTTVNRVSYNGGTGGIEARATTQEASYANERHVPPVAAQTEHLQAARDNPEMRASANHGVPPVAATSRPADFKTGAVAPKEADGEYKAPPASSPREASELQPHKYTAPSTGNAATDTKQQAQQDQLAAKQTQEHQQLQQQQDKEHQQATQKSYNDQQKQQLEEKHAQQTQQLEQKHATQQTKVQQKQTPPKTEPKS